MQFYFLWASLLVILYPTADLLAQVVVGQTHTIHSSVLKEQRNYRIYLPGSYAWAKERKYPVLYVLDGESQFLHTAASVDYLSTHGEIPEMIVVGIDSIVRVRDYSPTDWPEGWIGGGGAGNFNASCLLSSFQPSSGHIALTGSEYLLELLRVACLLCIA